MTVAGTSMTQERRARWYIFGFDEEFAKCRVGEVGGRRCENDFGIAGDFEFADRRTVVPDRDSAHLDVVFRRDRDVELRGDVPVAAPKARPIRRERHGVIVGLTSRGLIGGGPYDSAADIAQIDEETVRIARGVTAPSGHRQVAPDAAPSASIRHRRDVVTVRQELRMRYDRV